MTSNIAFLAGNVGQYLAAHSTPPTELEQRLIDCTAQLDQARMQIGAPQARFMALLTRILRPQTVVEIGTFTGYSALVVAQQLEPGSRLIACDTSQEWTDIAKPFWEEAGVRDLIDLRIGPGSETLSQLPAELVVDLAFIDADKAGYWGYLEQLTPHLRSHSVVLVDNVLWSGRVADPESQVNSTNQIRAFNTKVLDDPRFEVALLPIGDGLSMIMLASS